MFVSTTTPLSYFGSNKEKFPYLEFPCFEYPLYYIAQKRENSLFKDSLFGLFTVSKVTMKKVGLILMGKV